MGGDRIGPRDGAAVISLSVGEWDGRGHGRGAAQPGWAVPPRPRLARLGSPRLTLSRLQSAGLIQLMAGSLKICSFANFSSFFYDVRVLQNLYADQLTVSNPGSQVLEHGCYWRIWISGVIPRASKK